MRTKRHSNLPSKGLAVRHRRRAAGLHNSEKNGPGAAGRHAHVLPAVFGKRSPRHACPSRTRTDVRLSSSVIPPLHKYRRPRNLSERFALCLGVREDPSRSGRRGDTPAHPEAIRVCPSLDQYLLSASEADTRPPLSLRGIKEVRGALSSLIFPSLPTPTSPPRSGRPLECPRPSSATTTTSTHPLNALCLNHGLYPDIDALFFCHNRHDRHPDDLHPELNVRFLRYTLDARYPRPPRTPSTRLILRLTAILEGRATVCSTSVEGGRDLG